MGYERLNSGVDSSGEAGVSPYRFSSVEDIIHISLSEQVPPDINQSSHAFVVLGYELTRSGAMRDTLLGRLQVTKKAADRYENSKVVVSGGSPRGSTTEASVMYDWLSSEGIDNRRIIQEDQSRDTVENVLYSLEALEAEEVQSITLITSASHMRRALLLFLEADRMTRINSHMAHLDCEVAQGGFAVGERELIEHDLKRIIEAQQRSSYRAIGAGVLAVV